MSTWIESQKNKIYRLNEELRRSVEGLCKYLVEQRRRAKLGAIEPIVLLGVSPAGKVPSLRVFTEGGISLGEFPDTEDGRQRIKYYHVSYQEGDEIPYERESYRHLIKELCRGISLVAIEKGLEIDPIIKEVVSRILAGHPLANVALTTASRSVELDENYFLGWKDKPKDVPKNLGRKNVLLITRESCPYSRQVLSWLTMKWIEKRLFPLGVALMLLEEDERLYGIESVFGSEGTPTFVFCDEYFRIVKVRAGAITPEGLMREVLLLRKPFF